MDYEESVRGRIAVEEATLRNQEEAVLEIQRIQLDTQRIQRERQQIRLETQQLQEQTRRDIAALHALREENARLDSDRCLDAYLADVDTLHDFLPWLLTTHYVSPEDDKSQPSTAMAGKYYPPNIRQWDDCRPACNDAFERVRAAIGDAPVFPSIRDVRAWKRKMDTELPLLLLQSEGFMNQARASHVIHEALQAPAQCVMNAYLSASGFETRLYYDSSSRDKPTPKTRPDCLVLASGTSSLPPDADGLAGDAEDRVKSIYRVLMGEHKPLHRISAAFLDRLAQNPLPEDVMIQLATASSEGSRESERAGPEAESDIHETALAAGLTPGYVYFANALTQTFHYMVTSGLKYDFLTSGETLTFLKLPRHDPTTLLVHSEGFPKYCQPGSEETGDSDIRDLPVARLCGLSLLAYESTPASARQRSVDISQLSVFPNLPPCNSPQ